MTIRVRADGSLHSCSRLHRYTIVFHKSTTKGITYQTSVITFNNHNRISLLLVYIIFSSIQYFFLPTGRRGSEHLLISYGLIAYSRIHIVTFRQLISMQTRPLTSNLYYGTICRRDCMYRYLASLVTGRRALARPPRLHSGIFKSKKNKQVSAYVVMPDASP